MSPRLSPRAERGVFIPLIGIGLLLLIGILTFAVDLPNKEALSQELRRAMDSAALAGAQQLDGTVEGLQNAIKYVDHMFEDNLVGQKQVPQDFYDIEFGFYSFPDKKFTPYYTEDQLRGAIVANDTVELSGVPASAMINSLRVTASAAAPSIFSNVFGFYSLGDVSGNAVAVADRRSQVCAFPFAIPMCSLFLNQNPNVKIGESGQATSVTTSNYEAATQCKRPVYVTEANYEYQEMLRKQDRRDGVIRAAAFSKPEVVSYEAGNICGEPGGKTGGSCISLPIMGTFGVPARDYGNLATPEGEKYPFLQPEDGKTGITPHQLKLLLQKFADNHDSLPCMNFSIGDRIRSLDDYYDPGSPTNPVTGSSILVPGDTGSGSSSSGGSSSSAGSSSPAANFLEATDVDKALSKLIRGVSGETPVHEGPGRYLFREVFGDPSLTGTNGPKENFPYLRGAWDESKTIGQGEVKIISGDMSRTDFTNPLCHNFLWPANDIDAARVLKVVVPLVVPYQVEGSTALPLRYCDPSSLVGAKTFTLQSAPGTETSPQVVGFVEVNIFDFNFRWLPNTGYAVPDATGGSLVDNNPAGGLIPGFSGASGGGEPDDDSGDSSGTSGTGTEGSSGGTSGGNSGSGKPGGGSQGGHGSGPGTGWNPYDNSNNPQ